METTRAERPATLLPDGTVLVAGSYEEELGPNVLAISLNLFRKIEQRNNHRGPVTCAKIGSEKRDTE